MEDRDRRERGTGMKEDGSSGGADKKIALVLDYKIEKETPSGYSNENLSEKGTQKQRRTDKSAGNANEKSWIVAPKTN